MIRRGLSKGTPRYIVDEILSKSKTSPPTRTTRPTTRATCRHGSSGRGSRRKSRNPDDRAVYELLVENARGDESYDELAAERGESVNALTKRVQRFKAKYVPLRRRHNERRYMVLLLLRWGGIVAVVAGAAVAAYFLYRAISARPASLAPAPSASVPVLVVPPPSDDDVGHPRPK